MNQIDKVLKTKRGTDLHTTIVYSNADDKPKRLVLLAHGFKAERTEGGRFIQVAHNLALHGTCCICMSFPGCGDSTEDFTSYTIENCIDDIDTAYRYMLDNYRIDKDHIGMIGYSMGGRLTCIYSHRHPEIGTIALWTAASYNGNPGGEFSGRPIAEMIEEAKRNGYAKAVNAFDGEELHFSEGFLTQMASCTPHDDLAAYKGNVLIVHGDEDDIVPLEASLSAYRDLTTKKDRKMVVIKGANHGFGLWTDQLEQTEELVRETTDFFVRNL